MVWNLVVKVVKSVHNRRYHDDDDDGDDDDWGEALENIIKLKFN